MIQSTSQAKPSSKSRSTKTAASDAPPTIPMARRIALPPAEPLPVQRIPLGLIDRHPDNRAPSPADVSERAASMRELRQLEPALVRPRDGGRYQMVSGETRWLAARQLGWDAIEARVREMTDAEALAILGAANAQRKDLSPIERAELLAKLTTPEAEGGGGLSQDAAGELFALSRSAVSNAIRLLKLPASVRQLVAQGEIPESYARSLLSYLESPLAPAVEKKIADARRELAKREETFDQVYQREDFAHALAREAAHGLPRVEDKPCSWASKDVASLKRIIQAKGEGSQVFALDAAWQAELGLAEIKYRHGGGSFVATNVKAYQKRNLAAAEKRLAALAKKGKAEETTRAKADSGKSEAQKAKEAADRLKGRLEALTKDFRGWTASRAIEDTQLRALAAVWFLSDAGCVGNGHESRSCAALLREANDPARDAFQSRQKLAATTTAAAAPGRMFGLLARYLYDPTGEGHRMAAPVALAVLEASGRGNADLEEAWRRDCLSEEKRHLAAYLAAHDTEPLRRLLVNLRLPAGPKAKKGDLVLMATNEYASKIPLPKEYRLPEKRTTKKGAKGDDDADL